MDKLIKKIGEKVREIREEKGISVRELEKSSGLARSTISRIERGLFEDVGIVTLKKLADGLEMNLKELIPEKNPKFH